ncbi:MAG TPA: cupin domain-containing protein [Rhodanobacteraceae bacterium]|nr:cupin domain-containing protein [Rhodanobacteraceae bacterium]
MSNVRRDTLPIEVHATARQPLGMPPSRFLRDYWQKHPLLIRSAFPDFVPPLTPDDLAGLACEELALSRIVLRESSKGNFGRRRAPARADSGSPLRGVRNDDKWEVRTGPFDEATFAKLPQSHWTLLVQDVDKWDADVAALLDHFAFLPSWRIDDVMVSYATDGGGVGAHLDQYDVFLLQGLGQRRWSISTDPRASHDFRDDAELKLLKRFEPTHAWTLDPGDMLYLPPGVPHDGVGVGECMTFSIGMRAPASSELLVEFAEQVAAALPESQRYADPDLRAPTEPGEIDPAALKRARAALGICAQAMDEEAFADFFGRFITSYRSAQVVAPPRRRPPAAKALDSKLEGSTFLRNPWSRFAWRRTPRGAVLHVGGEAHACPTAWARALCGSRAISGAELATLPQRSAGVALLASLVQAGHVAVRRR